MGAELNAEIEHASPYGKAAAEKARRGQRRAIGALALGRYQRQQSAPAAAPRSLPMLPAPPPAPAAGPLRRAVVAAVAAVVIFRASRA
jgi:membrane protein